MASLAFTAQTALASPWRWPWRYYAWRLETYTGIPASEVTWHTFLTFFGSHNTAALSGVMCAG